jgi:hypothetical protein
MGGPIRSGSENSPHLGPFQPLQHGSQDSLESLAVVGDLEMLRVQPAA